MYRVFVVVVAALAAVKVTADEDLKKCMEVSYPGTFRCCKKGVIANHVFQRPEDNPQEENLKECFQLPGKPDSCERDKCIANKVGLTKSDGTIDKDTWKVKLSMKFRDIPEVMDKVVKNCIDGDISKFGPEDMCETLKLRQCLELQLLSSCLEWDNEPLCTGTKDLVEKCAKI